MTIAVHLGRKATKQNNMQTKTMLLGPFSGLSGLHQVNQKKVVLHIKLMGMKIRLKLASDSDVLLLLRRL